MISPPIQLNFWKNKLGMGLEIQAVLPQASGSLLPLSNALMAFAYTPPTKLPASRQTEKTIDLIL